MGTLEVLQQYLNNDVTLDDLHARLQAGSLTRQPDPFTAEALRLLGEATSANWPEESVRERFQQMMADSKEHGRIRLGWLHGSTHRISAEFAITRSAISIRGGGRNRFEGIQKLAHQPG